MMGYDLYAGTSIFTGSASWTFGVWLEALALAMIVGGTLRAISIANGRASEGLFGPNSWTALFMIPIALSINWAADSGTKGTAIAGDLDVRIESLNTLADACERTALDLPSCNTCCDGDVIFEDVCECIVPWRCGAGNANAEACQTCCSSEGGAGVTSRFYGEQGCVCNADRLGP